MGKTGAGPKLTTASETALKLLAQGLHRPAAHRGSSLLHSAVVEAEVFHPLSSSCVADRMRVPKHSRSWSFSVATQKHFVPCSNISSHRTSSRPPSEPSQPLACLLELYHCHPSRAQLIILNYPHLCKPASKTPCSLTLDSLFFGNLTP